MPNEPSAPEVLTLREAARYIRVSDKTLREMAKANRVPAQKVGREWRFLREALKQWLMSPPSTPAAGQSPSAGGNGQPAPSLASEPATLYQKEIKPAGFRDTGFKDNYDRAMHRWVPWIAGFSASFVEGILERFGGAKPGEVTVLDPFAGVGTTLVEALKSGHNAVGFEINPYAALASKAKTEAFRYDPALLRGRIRAFADFMAESSAPDVPPAQARPPAGFRSVVPFFSPPVERKVLHCFDFLAQEETPWVRDLFRLALGSAMVGFSNYTYEPSLGTRRGAGKPNLPDADVAGVLALKLEEMLEDIETFRQRMERWRPKPQAQVHPESYLESAGKRLAPRSVDALITSPPYLNNYHYIRNTRPQMFWLDMVAQPADLKQMERASFGQFWQTVRAGAPVPLEAEAPGLAEKIAQLRERNPEKGPYGGAGWANYAATYFNDCARFCRATREAMKPGGVVAVVIGNNILQGIEFPTDRYFAEIAERNGFEVSAIHEVRNKRTGTSIVNSSVRVGEVKKKVRLHESAVEMTVR